MTVCPGTVGPFSTGRIGFGCAYITGGFEKRRNLKLLQCAFDSGIRHYDTAPMYGHGTSESVVGEAFNKVRGQISITTKVGICRPNFPLKRKLLRAIATPVRHHLPELSQRWAARVYRSHSTPKHFAAIDVRRSVEDSLSQLRTDYIDALLLHEATPADINDELLNTLAALKAEGKILRTGVGSSTEDVASIDAVYPDFFDVYQKTWSILTIDSVTYLDKINIHHRSILDGLGPLRNKLASDLSFAKHMRKSAGLQLNAGDDLGKALISASVFVNPKGITLFGTRRLHRVAEYAKVAKSDLAPGIALLNAYRAHAEHASAPKLAPHQVL